jgi:hypothetical protein
MLSGTPPHRVAAPVVVIDSLPSRGVIAIGEVQATLLEIRAFRANMVIRHIQEDGEALRLAGIHQALQAMRRPIAVCGAYGCTPS